MRCARYATLTAPLKNSAASDTQPLMVYCGMVCKHAFDKQWRIPQKPPVAWKPESRAWLIGEIVTCLYVGVCRLRRGEQLSAWRFVQGHAFTLLLELIEFERSVPTLDVFSQERRFERRHPDWPALCC